jgi:hypothetical protein
VSPATPTDLRLRVTVADTWEVCPLAVRANESLGAVKRRALEAAGIASARAAAYTVKLGGALVRDEGRSLAELAVPDGAALVVLSTRRRAVR